MSWLSSVQDWFANAAKGNGVVIAVVLAALSAAIGVAVAVNWRPKLFLALAIVLESPLLGGRSGLRRHPSGRRDRPERRACCSSCSPTRCTRWCRTNNRLPAPPAEARTAARSPWRAEPDRTKFDSQGRSGPRQP